MAAADFEVAADIRKAETLPAEAFTEPAFLELELKTVFARHWLMLPQQSPVQGDERSLSDMTRIRGAGVPFSLAGRPLLLQRDWKGVLRLFPNVCTHAWYPLLEGPGRHRQLTCAQHGRSFDCAGRFVSQPGFTPDTQDFPRPSDHLRALPLEERAPLLFACLGEPAYPLDEVWGPVQDSVPGVPLKRLRRRPRPDEAREVDGNWKQHAWNYMDKFHISFIHRAPNGLADAVDMATYRVELGERAALQWVYARNPKHGFAPEEVAPRLRDAKRRVFAVWWFVFPNLTLNFYPWGLSVNEYLPIPGRPDKTLFIWHHFVRDEAKYARRNEIWLDEQVDAEDVNAMTLAGRGARSGLAPRGRFAPQEETGPHWFHRLVYSTAFS